MPAANFRYGAVTVHYLISIQNPLEKCACTCIVYMRDPVPLACVALCVCVKELYNSNSKTDTAGSSHRQRKGI